eukprot:scaffold2740_cov418-Prasinococcus_capsulatus_cf.AAC.13
MHRYCARNGRRAAAGEPGLPLVQQRAAPENGPGRGDTDKIRAGTMTGHRPHRTSTANDLSLTLRRPPRQGPRADRDGSPRVRVTSYMKFWNIFYAGYMGIPRASPHRLQASVMLAHPPPPAPECHLDPVQRHWNDMARPPKPAHNLGWANRTAALHVCGRQALRRGA